MVYKLAIVRAGNVVGVLGGDGLIHAHSDQTRTLTAPERVGERVYPAGSVVRVPDPLEDPQDETAFQGVEVALVQEVKDDVSGAIVNRVVVTFGDAAKLAEIAAAVNRQS